MRVFIALLKSLLIGLLLLLLLGSGACVFIDISFLMGRNNVSDQLSILLMTLIAAALAFAAGYGVYALIRSFGRGNNEREL